MEKKHVCPWWLGYFLINPLRKFSHNPQKILGPYISPGMYVVDFGCAMGYFSLPMARMTGNNGKVYCLDIQEKMLVKLRRRVEKAKLGHLMETQLITNQGTIKIPEKTIDFILLFAVVHEVDDQVKLFKSLSALLKPGGKVLIAEPRGHVSLTSYTVSLKQAEKAGLSIIKELEIANSHSSLLQKSE